MSLLVGELSSPLRRWQTLPLGTKGKICTHGCSIIISRRRGRVLLSRLQIFGAWLENPVCFESSVKDGNAVEYTVISVCEPEIFTSRNYKRKKKSLIKYVFPRFLLKKWIRVTCDLDNVTLKLKVWFFCWNFLGKIYFSTFEKREDNKVLFWMGQSLERSQQLQTLTIRCTISLALEGVLSQTQELQAMAS